MYRAPRHAAVAPSRRSRTVAPAPLPRAASLSPAPLMPPSGDGTGFLFPKYGLPQFVPGSQETLDGQMGDEQLNDEQFDMEDGGNGSTESGFYSNLVLSAIEESQVPTPPSAPTMDHGAATGKSQGRTKNFRDEEDILLVLAWLNVGMDPIQGVDQSQGTYWRRIYEYFHGNKKFDSSRSEGSLMNRWSGIQHDVNAFCGCLTRIQDMNRSGWSVDDKIANACTLFKTEDKKNRKFAYMHCWRILKDKPKWMERRKEIGSVNKTSNKKQKTMPNSSPGSVVPAAPDALAATGGTDTEASGRPDGKKKEKKKASAKFNHRSSGLPNG